MERDTREQVEEDFRYSAVDAMLDLVLRNKMTIEEVKVAYLEDYPEQRKPEILTSNSGSV